MKLHSRSIVIQIDEARENDKRKQMRRYLVKLSHIFFYVYKERRRAMAYRLNRKVKNEKQNKHGAPEKMAEILEKKGKKRSI